MTGKLPDEQWSRMLGFLRTRPDNIHRKRSGLPMFNQGRALDHAQRSAGALAASRVWQVGQRMQVLCALV
jgi:hypothetical protein